MSAIAIQGPSGASSGPVNAHVFCCPYCRNYTSLLSPFTFISEETAECHNCGQIFVVENDVAHAISRVDLVRAVTPRRPS